MNERRGTSKKSTKKAHEKKKGNKPTSGGVTQEEIENQRERRVDCASRGGWDLAMAGMLMW